MASLCIRCKSAVVEMVAVDVTQVESHPEANTVYDKKYVIT